MKLLKELLALREDNGMSQTFKDLDIWLGVGSKSNLESADVEVDYDYEPADYTDHPYGMGTAREHHAASVDVMAVRLIKDANEYDEDGDKVVKVLKAGTDLMEQPWWQADWTEWLADKIAEKIGDDDEDFQEPDFDDREGDYQDDYMSRHN